MKRLATFLALLAILGIARAENYSDLWWNPSESGWGLTIADHETQLFAVWYTYRSDGKPTWFVIPGGSFDSSRHVFTGDIYQTTGPPYSAPFDASRVTRTKVGTATLDFAPQGLAAGTALFTWSIGGASQAKQIQRQPFGNGPTAWGSDFTDIWWNPLESGWGLTLAQHGNNVFGVWFTYDASGNPLFVALPSVTFVDANTFDGTLYTTTGPPYTSATFDPSQVHLTVLGSATIHIAEGAGTFTSNVDGFMQAKNIVPQPFGATAPAPLGKQLLAGRGVWAIFDRRGYPNGYYSGDAIKMFDQHDQDLQNLLGSGANVAATVRDEIASQLGKMRAMGMNRITFELRATDPVFINEPFNPPDCNLAPSLGLLYPQPTAIELSNLAAFFDLAQANGFRVLLILNNTHMEEQPPTNNSRWLAAILNVVKNHPALDVVMFGGNMHVLTLTFGSMVSMVCGTPAEAPLYLGIDSYAGRYVQWAIGYSTALGVSPAKLSAEAIVGDYYVDQQPPAGPEATNSHLWSPIKILKQIFDNLGVDNSQRTYTLSFYSHRKCWNPNNFSIACTDTDPHTWADQTLQSVMSVVGPSARVVAAEFGDNAPFSPDWGAALAFESLASLMSKYGVEASGYWIWAETDNGTQADPNRPGEPVRVRGVNDVYNPVQRELVDAYGFHLAAIQNGSFEDGGATATGWTSSGAGTAARFRLADESGQPVIATRGSYALRLVTGNGSGDQVQVQGAPIAVTSRTTYTTTANLRFQWSGDSRVGSNDASRPHVFATIQYYNSSGAPSALRAQDVFNYVQEDSPSGFGTFPLVYTTPADATTVRIVFGAARNGLAQPITLDVDNVR